MNHDVQPVEDRRDGAFDRRMRERTPASDRRIDSRGQRSAGEVLGDEAAPAQIDSQMLFERS